MRTARWLPVWLHFPIVLLLATAAWISGLDSTGHDSQTFLLWIAAAVAAAVLALRLVLRLR